MTSLLDTAHFLADSTTSTTPSPEPFPNIEPVKPPFITDLFHKGVVLWWILLVAGVLALIGAAIDRITGAHILRGKAHAFTVAGGIAALGFGVLFLVLSY